jgi:hypothetical protein
MDADAPEETRRLNEKMALAAVEFFGTIIARRPPLSVVFTVWAAMTAADGWGWRPMWVRTLWRRWSWMRSHVPSRRQARKS